MRLFVDKYVFRDILMQDEGLLENLVEGLESNKSFLVNIIAEEQKRATNNNRSARRIIIDKIKKYFGIS